MSSEHDYKFEVEATCDGCSNAVKRILERYTKSSPGQISKYNVDLVLDEQKAKVDITSTMNKEELIQLLEKSGKKVTSVI
jgi:copper chaperone